MSYRNPELWFEECFGFIESSIVDYLSRPLKFQIHIDSHNEMKLIALDKKDEQGNQGKEYFLGKFSMPTLRDLRERVREQLQQQEKQQKERMNEQPKLLGSLTFENLAGDARTFLRKAENDGAFFQVASQFNCLEMTSYAVAPEEGITGYVYDATQGPICALSCPAALVYRNYFALDGKPQTLNSQLNLLDEFEKEIYGSEHMNDKTYRHYNIQNGYAMFKSTGQLQQFCKKYLLNNSSNSAARYDELLSLCKVGVHWSTSVRDCSHRIGQIFCSALPVSYDENRSSSEDWAPFAKFVLDSLYEATLLVAAVQAFEENKRKTVYLTLVGAGAFGNDHAWVKAAIQRAINLCHHLPIDVKILHYRKVLEEYLELKVPAAPFASSSSAAASAAATPSSLPPFGTANAAVLSSSSTSAASHTAPAALTSSPPADASSAAAAAQDASSSSAETSTSSSFPAKYAATVAIPFSSSVVVASASVSSLSSSSLSAAASASSSSSSSSLSSDKCVVDSSCSSTPSPSPSAPPEEALKTDKSSGGNVQVGNQTEESRHETNDENSAERSHSSSSSSSSSNDSTLRAAKTAREACLTQSHSACVFL